MNDSIFGDGRILFLDGGMGTQLQAKGLQPGEIPELWNVSRPSDVRAVQSRAVAVDHAVAFLDGDPHFGQPF